MLEDSGDEVTRSGKSALVKENLRREGLEAFRRYVLHLQPVDVALLRQKAKS